MGNNFSKFKRGDKVENKYGGKFKVLNTFKINGKFMIQVESDSGMRTDYKEEDLKFYHADIAEKSYVAPEHIGEKCPVCSTPWTITNFGAKAWKDCKPCGKTAEDLLDRSSERSSSSSSDYESTDDWYNVLKDRGSD